MPAASKSALILSISSCSCCSSCSFVIFCLKVLVRRFSSAPGASAWAAFLSTFGFDLRQPQQPAFFFFYGPVGVFLLSSMLPGFSFKSLIESGISSSAFSPACAPTDPLRSGIFAADSSSFIGTLLVSSCVLAAICLLSCPGEAAFSMGVLVGLVSGF